MFSKGGAIAKEVERIKENLQIDTQSPNSKILNDIVVTIYQDDDAIETLQNITTYRDLFELYTTQQIGLQVYSITFEENETNSIRNKLLAGEELMGENWSKPGVIKQHLLDLVDYMNKSNLKKISSDELTNIFTDVDVAKYILSNCSLLEKDSQGRYGFKSDEFLGYMNANLTLKATTELGKK